MKVLVIGASGLVGRALVRASERSGFDAVSTSLSGQPGPSLHLDVRDADAVRATMARIEPEVIFLAVNTRGGVDACEAEPAQALSLNVDGTRQVAEATARQGARLVYYSSDYVFDGRRGPYSEGDEPCPVSVYGRTKLEAENLVHTLVLDHLIIRTTAVFGWERGSRNFAMQVWETLQAGRTLRVPSDQWCNPTLSDYLAEVSVRLVQMGATGTFHVVGGDRMPRSEMAKALARAMALDPELILAVPTAELNQKALRPLQGGLKTAKLQQFLGTVPLNLSDSLKRFRRQWRADTHVTCPPPAAL
jgi:dTDP-4-dehydrorhamnose reductase